MCLKSPAATAAQKAMNMKPSSSSHVVAPSVVKVKAAEVHLIDCREQKEWEKEHIDGAHHMPMSVLLKDAMDGKLDHLKDKKMVIYCESGKRSMVATETMIGLGFDAASMDGGLGGWRDPAVANYEWISLVGILPNNVEKITLALTTAVIALAEGTSALVLMSDGVEVCKKGEIATMNAGDAYQSMSSLMEKFIKDGGVVFGCRSCMKSRKLEYGKDTEDYMVPCSAPDVVRWLKHSQGNMQIM